MLLLMYLEFQIFFRFQGKFQEAGKLYKKTGNDEKVWYMQGCVKSLWVLKGMIATSGTIF